MLFTLSPTHWLDIFAGSLAYLKKIPRRWTLRFLFNQRVSNFLSLAKLFLWHVNGTLSYDMCVAFCLGIIRTTRRCGGVFSSADFVRVFEISSRWEVDSSVHMFCYCVYFTLVPQFLWFSIIFIAFFSFCSHSLANFLHIVFNFLVSTAASACFLTLRFTFLFSLAIQPTRCRVVCPKICCCVPSP